MISAPSHLQPLSGNKFGLLVALACVFILNACSSTQQLPHRTTGKNTTKTTKTNQNKSPKVDTVAWTEVQTSKDLPIRDTGSVVEVPKSSEKKQSYSIAALFPFDTKAVRWDNINIQDRFLNYYCGMQMALDILNNQGKKIQLHVHDSSDAGSNMNSRLDAWGVKDRDVILAPFHREQVEQVAAYGMKHKIPTVSPWLVSSKVTKENPYYIKLLPDITDYYHAIMVDVARKYSPEQVVIMGNSKDKSKIKYLKDLAVANYPPSQGAKVKELIIDVNRKLEDEEPFFNDLFVPGKTTVVILPNFASSDEDFVYGACRYLSVEKFDNDVVVYGMPLLSNSERMEYDYFSSLKMHVAKSKFVDHENPRVKSFRSDYVYKYGAIPTDDAYEGYDMMMYVAEQLFEHGVDFAKVDPSLSEEYLQSSFKIEPRADDENLSDDIGMQVDYFLNTHIDIIAFKNNRFQKSK